MSIVIFGDLFKFPEGSAATNRVYTYAKGFAEQGINVHVICFCNEYLETNDGMVDGIYFYHPFGQTKRSNSFFVRRWKNFLKYFRTYFLFRKINKQDKIIAVNGWTNLVITHLFGWFLTRSCGSRLITEVSEHPLRYFQNGSFKRQYGKFKFFIESRFCDGVLCISNYLVDLHLKSGVRAKKLFLVPSTVEPSRFEINVPKPVDYRYVGYFGSLTFKRDSVDTLIKAFAQFAKSHPDICLVLGGFCSQNEKKELLGLVEKLNIGSRVNLLPYMSRQEILKYIVHADILVMVRADDLESKASYPSKLTEFLATGKPVLTVDVGEISEFLTDGENAYVVKQGDVPAMAEKLDYMISNYDCAKKAGKKGKELTGNVFNYAYQGKRIVEYVHTLYKK